MKREIKFKGKRIDNGEWVYGNLVTYFNKPAIQDYAQTNGEIFLVDPETVGQYTGLKDRNGKEIYEGDILKVNKLSFKSSWPLPENLLVKFYGGMFQLYRGDENLMGLHLMYIEECEVIGNRWDNPNLLEVTHE
ncbi:YopX family protein [Paenibacillus lautus]|uniref:YopX family protein n=1 Tax=Paenibacillus lautus TaxID=1401 RepID=UPI002040E740|nr:YopX family protein [Paenibacillus lautus]MCM3257126.1 YopX family protein [Paenibacillus lautus]